MAIIVHLDLDSFFASCERVRNPELEETGIVICMFSGRGENGGAVSTADYIARDHGIHAAMPIVQAREIAENTAQEFAFLQADKDYYKQISERIMEILEEHVGEVEAASIDEGYGDLSDLESYEAAVELVSQVKADIEEQEGITASAGIGPNKLIAKMASDRDKPDGLTVVKPEDVDDFLQGLPVEELHGIGPKTATTLREMGAETVDELREIPRQRLVREFGESRGVSIAEKARGEGAEELEERTKKQFSRLRTLEQDTRSMSVIRPTIRELADRVVERLERREKRYTTASVVMVTGELETRTRSKTLKAPTTSVETLFRTAEELAEEFLSSHPDTELRRVGVRVGGFRDQNQRRLDGF